VVLGNDGVESLGACFNELNAIIGGWAVPPPNAAIGRMIHVVMESGLAAGVGKGQFANRNTIAVCVFLFELPAHRWQRLEGIVETPSSQPEHLIQHQSSSK
jgi:hypothetical protein